jgi:cobaltochelatase CobN
MMNMAAILLTAANKGFWKANPDTIRDLANTLGRLVVRYGPACSAHVCGNVQTTAWSQQWMNPELQKSYARAMRAALSGNGYSGITPSAKSARGIGRGAARGTRPLFDFTASRAPDPSLAVSVIEDVFRRIRSQDWSDLFLGLFLFVLPAGLMIFFVRDRYYRRRGSGCIALTLKVRS